MVINSNKPSELNGYLQPHVRLLLDSFHHWTGKNLIRQDLSGTEQARQLFYAPFVVLSHNSASDPLLNYANEAGLHLFELNWEELIALPSRFTAEPLHRDERARLLRRVTEHGYIDDYSGVRISRAGRRFLSSRQQFGRCEMSRLRPTGKRRLSAGGTFSISLATAVYLPVRRMIGSSIETPLGLP